MRFLYVLASLFAPLFVFAQETPHNEHSLFLKPQFLELYKQSHKSLTESDQWKIKLYGLRMAPLHPEIWAVRKIDRTENRRLVAIKPYYLRISEDSNFVIEEFTINFAFKNVSEVEETKKYQEKDSVLDIGFGGIYEEGLPQKRPKRDNSYVLRLTAFSDFKSGLYYRSYDKHLLLTESKPISLKTAKKYELKILFKSDEAKALLNGKDILSFKKENINKGLFYLTTSWNPLRITDLKIKGHYKDKENLTQSGLYKLKLRGKEELK